MAAASWMDTRGKPGVLLLLCTKDFNGAFSDEELRWEIDGLSRICDLYTYRVRNESDLYGGLERAKREGVECICIAGHGSESKITLSEEVVIEDGRLFEGRLWTECTKMVLCSCSTGESNTSVAARLSLLGLCVLAPMRVIGRLDIRPNSLFLHKSDAFPVNILGGQMFEKGKWVGRWTGYETVTHVDLIHLSRDARIKEIAYRAIGLVKVGKLHLAKRLFCSIIHRLPTHLCYEMLYLGDKLYRLVCALRKKGEVLCAGELYLALERYGKVRAYSPFIW